MRWYLRASGPAGVFFASLLYSGGCAATPAGRRPLRPSPGPPATARDPDGAGLHAAVAGERAFSDYRPGLEQAPFQSRLLTNLTRHTFTSQGRDFDPDLDRAGQTLLFASTRNAEHPDIYLKRVDGTAMTQLTSDPADDIQPRFSPDGRRIAFCSNRSGNWDIWMLNRDGTGLTQLTRDRADEIAPCWHPDGSQIAYTLWGRRSHRWEIWTLAVDQPGVRRFLAYGMFPAWSPQGDRIAFQRARQRGSRWFSVWTLDVVGGEARHPTEVAYSELAACICPRWSPDGKMLVFCAVRPDRRSGGGKPGDRTGADLWVIDVASGLRLKLSDDGQPAFNPTWGPNGRVFFVSARCGAENIWSLATEAARRPPAQRAAAGAGGTPALAKDAGRRGAQQ